jgi:hypothetical protein
MIQEVVDLELQEIFGLFGKKPAVQGPGSTERLTQEPVERRPTEKFSFLRLKQLKTSRDIRNYVEKTLKPIGHGNSRTAYAIDENQILKVAKNDDQTYQNKNEIENSKCLGPKFAVQVLSFHPRYIWIVEERAKLISPGEIVRKVNQLTGLGSTQLAFKNPNEVRKFFTDVPALLTLDFENIETQRAKLASKDLIDSVERHLFMVNNRNEWYAEFSSKLKGCQFATWDFHAGNWGIRPSTGELILLDLGFTRVETTSNEQSLKEAINKIIQEQIDHQFDLSTLRTFENLEDIHKYCYETLGNETMNGKTRLIWIIDDSKVLKVIDREKSWHENRNEVKNAKCLGEKYAVKIFDYDHEQFFWVVEERVKAFPTAFVVPEFVELMNSILGTNYDEWFPIMQLFFDEPDPTKEELMKNNEWFREIVHRLKNCDVGSRDLHPGNWGVRPSTGELVILDLGF